MSLTVTNIDSGSVFIGAARFQDDVLTLAGADTIAPGTILARDSSTGKLVLYVKGGTTNENGIPKAVLTYQVVSTGAGDSQVRVGITGEVNKERLVIDADGDASNVDDVVKDLLRNYGIVATEVTQLADLDNQ